MRDETLFTYALELVGPRPNLWHPFADKIIWRIPVGVLRETEENLTDLLPPGYSVRITEEEK